MSVLIQNMAKPKSCVRMVDGELELCPFVNTDDDCVLQLGRHCYGTWEDQYADCPLVELPEKHGRLFDETEVKKVLHDLPDSEDKWGAIALLEWAVEKRWCVDAEGEKMRKLKPCPFCGGKAELTIIPWYFKSGLSSSGWVVRCLNGCCNQSPYMSDHDAVEAWNRRASDGS